MVIHYVSISCVVSLTYLTPTWPYLWPHVSDHPFSLYDITYARTQNTGGNGLENATSY